MTIVQSIISTFSFGFGLWLYDGIDEADVAMITGYILAFFAMGIWQFLEWGFGK